MTAPHDITEFNVGDTRALTIDVSEELLAKFVALTGDVNPLHMSDDFAAAVGMNRRVVHGMAYASWISTLIGMHLPGPGALWANQRISWLIPVRLGDRLTLTGRVAHVSVAQRAITLDVDARNQKNETVMTGVAHVILTGGQSRAAGTAAVAPVAVQAPPSERRLALVTGASGAVGGAIAAALARQGCDIALHFHSNRPRAERLAADITGQSPVCHVELVQADLAVAGAGASVVEHLAAQGRSPAVLVLNASPPPVNVPIGTLDWDRDVRPQLEAVIRGSLELCQACMPGMRDRRDGRIIGVLSNVLRGEPNAGWTPYILAKSGLQSLLRSLAVELGPSGITVNSVMPGMMDTAMTEGLSQRVKEIEARRSLTRRLTSVEDVAAAVAFLASSSAAQITGTTFSVDGGARL